MSADIKISDTVLNVVADVVKGRDAKIERRLAEAGEESVQRFAKLESQLKIVTEELSQRQGVPIVRNFVETPEVKVAVAGPDLGDLPNIVKDMARLVYERKDPEPTDMRPLAEAVDRMSDRIENLCKMLAEQTKAMLELAKRPAEVKMPESKKRKRVAKGKHEDGTPFEITISEE